MQRGKELEDPPGGIKIPLIGDVDISVDPLDLQENYSQQLGAQPLLSIDQTLQLFNYIRAAREAEKKLRTGSYGHSTERKQQLLETAKEGKKARQLLAAANTRLVMTIAAEYCENYSDMNIPLLEFIQEANLALVKATQYYNPAIGSFSTLAGVSIRRRLNDFLFAKKDFQYSELKDEVSDDTLSTEARIEFSFYKKLVRDLANPRELLIIRLLSDYDFTFEEIGNLSGVTRHAILSVRDAFAEKLTSHLADNENCPRRIDLPQTQYSYESVGFDIFKGLSGLCLDAKYLPGIRFATYLDWELGKTARYELANRILSGFENDFIDWQTTLKTLGLLLGGKHEDSEATLNLNILPFLDCQSWPWLASQAWLGGMWEVSGTVSFDAAQLAPLMKLGDSRVGFLEKYQALVGLGSVGTKAGRYKYWNLSRKGAVGLLSYIGQYAPSLGRHQQFFEFWLNAQSNEEKQILVQTFFEQGGAGRDYQVCDYDELIRDPDFFAGVVDQGGHFGWREKENLPLLHIASSNLALMQAIHRQWKGNLSPEKNGNSYRWRISGKKVEEINQFIEPYRRIPKKRAD